MGGNNQILEDVDVFSWYEWSEMSSPLTGDSEELMCCGAAVLQGHSCPVKCCSGDTRTPDPLASAANIYLDLYHEAWGKNKISWIDGILGLLRIVDIWYDKYMYSWRH